MEKKTALSRGTRGRGKFERKSLKGGGLTGCRVTPMRGIILKHVDLH